MQSDRIQILENILAYFYKHRLENVIVSNIWRDFAETDKDFYLLIMDLESKGLIQTTEAKTANNPRYYMYIITDKGVAIMESGGIEKDIKRQSEKEERQEIKETMEYQKLSGEIFDLNNKLKDYPQVKKQAFVGLIIAFLAVVIAFIALFIKK